MAALEPAPVLSERVGLGHDLDMRELRIQGEQLGLQIVLLPVRDARSR